MNKLPVISLIVTVLVLFFFQNCNRMTATADLVNSAENPSVSKSNIPVDGIKTISFYIDGVQTVNKIGGSYSVKYNKILKLNLLTKELVETNDLDSGVQVYCLPAQAERDLLDILSNSQVCKSQAGSGEQACGMALQLPYCEIEMHDEVIALGSATDTCHSNSVDLCDTQQIQELKSYIESFKKAYSAYGCN